MQETSIPIIYIYIYIYILAIVVRATMMGNECCMITIYIHIYMCVYIIYMLYISEIKHTN